MFLEQGYSKLLGNSLATFSPTTTGSEYNRGSSYWIEGYNQQRQIKRTLLLPITNTTKAELDAQSY